MQQLASVKVTSTSTHQTLFTVAAGQRWVVRSVALQNLWTTHQGILLFLPDPAQVFFKDLGAHNSGTDSFEWRPWLVCTPGQVCAAFVGNAAGIQVLISGSIYTI